MHLLATTAGSISDGDEAIDLIQTPGDIVILTVADSELACFARAAERIGDAPYRLRLVNLLQLRHPFSVDNYIDRVLRHARFIAINLLGGKSYWAYGIDRIAELARERGIALATLSNGADHDPDLIRAATVTAEMRDRLEQYFVQGGVANAENFIRLAAHMAGLSDHMPPLPAPLPEFGLHAPGRERPGLAEIRADWDPERPVAVLVFYRALMIAGTLEAVDEMTAELRRAGFNVLPLFVRSLRGDEVGAWLRALMAELKPDVIINTTAFAASTPGRTRNPSPLEAADCVILQAIFSGMTEDAWLAAERGLGSRDLGMNVAVPEVDGRVLSRAVAFKAEAAFDRRTECAVMVPRVRRDRARFVAALAGNWARLRRTGVAERRIALVLANYPNREARIGNGVGLDTPESALTILRMLAGAGYAAGALPANSAGLMELLTGGVTNDVASLDRGGVITVACADYAAWFADLPPAARDAVHERWGVIADDPFVRDGVFHLPARRFGNLVVAIQPARGYQIDPRSSYHDPALPPPHSYLAFYYWLRHGFDAHAVVSVGKHGNVEWLPGKAVSLSTACFTEIAVGPLPQLYPFIVNDPGEGTQAKRRMGAVIVDHLTPPLTRAESYGPLKQLEVMIDEYYQAAAMDPRRLPLLRRDILEMARLQGLDIDADADGGAADDDAALMNIDAYLCELKELQIRDGLHVFGHSPAGPQRRDLLVALARVPRGLGEGADQSLLRAMAADLALAFDPLDAVMNASWNGPRPAALAAVSADPWRTAGDTIERLELLALRLVEDMQAIGPATAAVIDAIRDDFAPRIDACGSAELAALRAGLDGRFVLPGPSGAPTRGRPEVLPTGRNFYSVDVRAVPTPAAWALGKRSARLLVEDYLQREGDYPRSVIISAWGTANMRTGGDDIAQALALMGVELRWEWSSGRVTGFDILPVAALGRPRVDVTFRISGFFRDAFPDQINLLDSAARAIMQLAESDADNPAAARFRAEEAELRRDGLDPAPARQRAGARVFGSRPGAYGAGLQTMIDERLWENRNDLGESYINWGGYSYGAEDEGSAAHALFRKRLSGIQAAIQNQDNREHDLLDSDDYYQFEGGVAAAVEAVSGRPPLSYHNDHSRPETPRIRTLGDEIGRILRGRLVNPKWLAGVMRHGYKGAFEIAASVDYLFGFAATTNAVRDHHFDLVHAAIIEDETVREFLRGSNPAALRDIADRLREAIDRGLWRPRSNSAAFVLSAIGREDNGTQ